jgi:hypothetical protein
MLLNEAKIYNAFPRKLQDGDAPIVPKFYGYYVPSTEAFDRDDNGNNGVSGDDDGLNEEEWKTVRTLFGFISPILLLEACGKQVHTRSLSQTDKWAHNFNKITDRKGPTP